MQKETLFTPKFPKSMIALSVWHRVESAVFRGVKWRMSLIASVGQVCRNPNADFGPSEPELYVLVFL